MTFTSNKSMEIEVFVDADPLVEAEKGKYRAVTAFFTYISLDKENKPFLCHRWRWVMLSLYMYVVWYRNIDEYNVNITFLRQKNKP